MGDSISTPPGSPDVHCYSINLAACVSCAACNRALQGLKQSSMASSTGRELVSRRQSAKLLKLLSKAVNGGTLQHLKSYIESNGDPNAVVWQDASSCFHYVDSSDYTGAGVLQPLAIGILYAGQNKLEHLKLLLQSGMNVEVEARGLSPLAAAAHKGNIGVMRLLISHGAPVGGRKSSSPLPLACQHGQLAAAQLLVSAGADIAQVVAESPGGGLSDSVGNPLMAAAHAGHTATVRWLLDRGAPLSATAGGLSMTALHAAAGGIASAEYMQMVVDAGLPVDSVLTDGETALLWAARKKKHAAMSFLIKLGADLDLQEKQNQCSPLHKAVLADDAVGIKLLLDAGANM